MEKIQDQEDELTNLVIKITTTGMVDLDEKLMKSIKKGCKHNEAYLEPVFRTAMKQLKRKHSEIRLSTFQMMKELFERSHQFRLLVLEDLYTILELTLETNNVILPPPKAAAKRLRTLTSETMHQWVKKFGSAYRKLEHGYNYLRQVKRVCINDIEGRSAIERQREEEKKLKMDNLWRERVRRVKNQMDENEIDINDCITQLNSCIELLKPRPDNFLFGQDELKEDESSDIDFASHGIIDPKTKISIKIDLNPDGDDEIKETVDNKEILTNLREQHLIFINKLNPLVKKWVVTLTKSGEICDSNLLKKAIDMKTALDEVECKLKAFDKVLAHKILESDSDDEDSDDFIEVADKSGFEATVQAEDHLLGINFYPSMNQPSTSKGLGSIDQSRTKPMVKKKKNLDIKTLTEEQKLHKVVINTNTEHFWSSGMSCRDDDNQIIEMVDPNTTTFEVEETFEEVKWTCRAPLPSGRLCPRKDRVKCPLHGKVIARDNMGNPVDKNDSIKSLPQEMDNDWQDPELLRDIEAATGINLKMPNKKGKGKKSKESNLTNIKAMQNTVRKRLEKKIFNRSSMKRVATDLNLSESKVKK